VTGFIDFASDFADMMIKHKGLRYCASTKDADGRSIPSASREFTFKGTHPQPAGQNDLRMLAEGSTPSSAIVIHSVQKLNITDNGKKGDVVIWDCEKYIVVQSNRRTGHHRNLLRKVQAGE
tara:strand:+ start:68 stop:430 length:363 start_codon:yes stop_codon:yes gene_type:complete